MKFKFHGKILSVITLIINACCWLSFPVSAASFSLTASATQVAPGANFTISVGGDCVGRINLKATGGSVAESAVWVEENRKTISVTAGSSGSVIITATPEAGLSDSNGDPYNPGSRSVTVKIVTPSQPTTQTSTSTNNTKPQSSTAKPTSSSQSPTTQPAENASANPAEKSDDTSKPEDSAEKVSEDTTEDASSSDEPPEESPTPCPTSSTETLAWILTIIFGLLFTGVTIALVCVLLAQKSQKTQKAQKSQTAKTKKVISKNAKA